MIRQGTETHVPRIFPLQPDEFQTGELRDQRRSTFNYPTAATSAQPAGRPQEPAHTHSPGTDVPKCYVLGPGSGSVIENSVPSRESSELSMWKRIIKEMTMTKALRIQGRSSSKAGLIAIINFFPFPHLLYSLGNYSVISYPPLQLEVVGDAVWGYELLSRIEACWWVFCQENFCFPGKKGEAGKQNDLPGNQTWCLDVWQSSCNHEAMNPRERPLSSCYLDIVSTGIQPGYCVNLDIQSTGSHLPWDFLLCEKNTSLSCDFIFGGFKITADGDYSHEIKRHLCFEGKLWPT